VAGAHRLVDPVAPSRRRRRLRQDAAIEPEQVDLDAGVHHHQLAEQGLHRARIRPARGHQLGMEAMCAARP
jgi:hypothetical protein